MISGEVWYLDQLTGKQARRPKVVDKEKRRRKTLLVDDYTVINE